jgi:hypothetical protein
MEANFCMTFLFVLFSVNTTYAEPLLRGSPESQIKQNVVADKNDLIRITDDTHLEELKAGGELVRIPETVGIKIDPRLTERFRYVRPFVADYLILMGREFHDRFKTELQINSAVRTASHQLSISGSNKNAAPIKGLKRSAHLTGAAIDIAKLTLTRE